MKNAFRTFLYPIFLGILVDGLYPFGNEHGDYWLPNILDSTSPRKSSTGLLTSLQTQTRINISNDLALLPNLNSQTSYTLFFISYKNSAPLPGGNAPNSKTNSGIISCQPGFETPAKDVSSYGFISLQKKYNGYLPAEYPFYKAMIAPFWADVDLGRGGTVWFRVTTENTIKQLATNDVKAYFPRSMDFQASWIFISTWQSVTFYGCSFGLGCLKVLYTKDSLIISFLF
uniref:Sushi, nidogen and EGF-like domain-containing protein 1 n=1 Tax=Magallana gigas TaxID=29159 RepID=K1R9N1_MAGGI